MITSWADFIRQEQNEPYYQELGQKLQEEAKQYTIYPKHEDLFNAFKYCPLEKTRIVCLGQDPYINENQAHGLAFSVPTGQAIPPSLRNIFQEAGVKSDNGCLIPWAQQGVLLLNSILTVREGQSSSHKDLGWQIFTDKAITHLATHSQRPLVFLLWGAFAKSKKTLITDPKHLILTAPHPSPLSAHKGFLGCGHFTQANQFLINNNIEPIDWSIT
jgi:uracil-DNA glycosylase